MRIAFLTLGCKVNSYETEKMKNKFEAQGCQVVSFSEQADVYLINTCSVTNIADRKSRKMLHRAKKMNPDSIVVATGCYVDSAKAKNEVDASVDLAIPNKDKEQIVELVLNEVATRYATSIQAGNKGMSRKAQEEEHTRAYLKVQDGCNQYCTYCIIPYLRGPLTSKPVSEVVSEVEKLAQDGIKEVVITGIHLSSYGVDDKKSGSFLELQGKPLLALLKEVAKVQGIERIRLGSLEPRIVTSQFAKELASIEKVCPHFHLSLQSGCDETLKRMNRHYSTEEYLENAKILKEAYVNPAITTDIIVGFPGETEQEFEKTCEYAREVGFAQIHVFKYSRRQGTIADKMENQVQENIKGNRSERLLQIENELEAEYRNNFVDTRQKVLFEEIVEMDGKNFLVGYTERYVRVAVQVKDTVEAEKLCNAIVEVHIVGQKNDILFGEF